MEQMHLIVYKVSGLTSRKELYQMTLKHNHFSEHSQGLYHKELKPARKILKLFSNNHVAGGSVSLRLLNVSYEIKQMCKYIAVIENWALGHEKRQKKI